MKTGKSLRRRMESARATLIATDHAAGSKLRDKNRRFSRLIPGLDLVHDEDMLDGKVRIDVDG